MQGDGVARALAEFHRHSFGDSFGFHIRQPTVSDWPDWGLGCRAGESRGGASVPATDRGSFRTGDSSCLARGGRFRNSVDVSGAVVDGFAVLAADISNDGDAVFGCESVELLQRDGEATCGFGRCDPVSSSSSRRNDFRLSRAVSMVRLE